MDWFRPVVGITSLVFGNMVNPSPLFPTTHKQWFLLKYISRFLIRHVSSIGSHESILLSLAGDKISLRNFLTLSNCDQCVYGRFQNVCHAIHCTSILGGIFRPLAFVFSSAIRPLRVRDFDNVYSLYSVVIFYAHQLIVHMLFACQFDLEDRGTALHSVCRFCIAVRWLTATFFMFIASLSVNDIYVPRISELTFKRCNNLSDAVHNYISPSTQVFTSGICDNDQYPLACHIPSCSDNRDEGYLVRCLTECFPRLCVCVSSVPFWIRRQLSK